MRRPALSRPIFAGILAMSSVSVRPVLAQNSSCAPLMIDADASVDTRFPGLLAHLRQRFETSRDIDPCARVHLTLRDGSIYVTVALPDGRSAARSVSRGDDVVPTLDALLVVPERSAERQAAEVAPSESPPSVNPMAAAARSSPATPPSASAREAPSGPELAVPNRDASAPSRGHESHHVRVELSVATGARIGDGQTSVGFGAVSFLELSGWLVGFEGRADRYRTIAGPRDGAALELALLAGRRFRFGDAALDFVAGPAAAVQGTATFETQSPTGRTVETSSSTVPRLVLGARANFSALSTVHGFLGVDGDIGPSRAGSTDVPGAPRLPIWTLGLALGVTVGTS